MKIKFIHYDRKQKEFQFRILISPDDAMAYPKEMGLKTLLTNSIVDSMNMDLTYDVDTRIYTIKKCDSLSALLFNIKKRMLDNGVSQEDWTNFLDDIRKAGIEISIGSKEKLDTLLPIEIRMLISENLGANEVDRLLRVSRLFQNETKQVGYWRKQLIRVGCSESLINEAIRTGEVSDYKILYHAYREWLRWVYWNDQNINTKINHLGTLFCLSGDVNLVRYAIEHQLVDAHFKDEIGNNALLLTARSGSAEAMVEAKKIPEINLTAVNTYGENALHIAASSGSPAAIQEAAQLGFDVNAKSGRKLGERSVLFYAVESNSVEVIRETAKLPGLDVNARDVFGNNALSILCEYVRSNKTYGVAGYYSSFKTVLEASNIPGINVNARNSLSYNVLMRAISRGAPLELIQNLARIPGLNVLATDRLGNNVLHIAVNYQHQSSGKLLVFLRRLGLSYFPNIGFNVRNNDGKTPLALAYSLKYIGTNLPLAPALVRCYEQLLTVKVQPLFATDSEIKTNMQKSAPNASSEEQIKETLHTKIKEKSLVISTTLANKATLDHVTTNTRLSIAGSLIREELARLSRVSSFFYEETKQLGYWINKLTEVGCSESLLNEIIQTGVVTDYRNIYRVFKNYKKREDIEIEISSLGILFCLSGEAGLVRYAVDNKLVDANFKNEEEMNAFHLTALSGSVKAMQESAKIPELNLTAKSSYGNALVLAGHSGSAEAIRAAAKIPGMDVNSKNGWGNALHVLIKSGGASPEAIRVFAEIPEFHVNEKDDEDVPKHVLHLALELGSPAAVREIGMLPGLDVNSDGSEYVASVEYRGYSNDHLLLRAVRISSPEMIQEIAKIPGLDVSKRNSEGNNALHLAIKRGSLAVVQEVAKIPGIYLAAVDNDRNNVLHTAAYHSNPEIIIFLRRLFLSHSPKIDFNRPNKKGKIPLMCVDCSMPISGKMVEALSMNVQPLPVEKTLQESTQDHNCLPSRVDSLTTEIASLPKKEEIETTVGIGSP